MPKLDDQISTLQQRLQLLKLRQQRTEARQRAILATRDRKADTRRKILLGGLVMEKLRQGELNQGQVTAWLDHALVRASDRSLFDLPTPTPTQPPLAAPTAAAEPPAAP